MHFRRECRYAIVPRQLSPAMASYFRSLVGRLFDAPRRRSFVCVLRSLKTQIVRRFDSKMTAMQIGPRKVVYVFTLNCESVTDLSDKSLQENQRKICCCFFLVFFVDLYFFLFFL